MTSRNLLVKKLAEQVLSSGGGLPLRALLEASVPVGTMRALAREFGLSPKGFRVEKAPARILAPLLAEVRDGEQLDQVLEALLDALTGGSEKPEPHAQPPAPKDLTPVLRLREQELGAAKKQLERAQKGLSRAQEREVELRRRLALASEQVARLRRTSGQESRPPAPAGQVGDRDQARRIRELERDLEILSENEEALRRLLSLRATRIRSLEEQVGELEELVPKGRRRKKRPPPEETEPNRRLCLPFFTPAFYKSLEGKDRRSVEKAFQAVLLYCTEGPAYPGLEAKPMGGQDTWSLRAGLRHRVYYQPRPDGDVTILAMADREDQHTTLRRLKER